MVSYLYRFIEEHTPLYKLSLVFTCVSTSVCVCVCEVSCSRVSSREVLMLILRDWPVSTGAALLSLYRLLTVSMTGATPAGWMLTINNWF